MTTKMKSLFRPPLLSFPSMTLPTSAKPRSWPLGSNSNFSPAQLSSPTSITLRSLVTEYASQPQLSPRFSDEDDLIRKSDERLRRTHTSNNTMSPGSKGGEIVLQNSPPTTLRIRQTRRVSKQ
jgi:hypothetical protein